ncbi:MAG: DUF6176 family protein [Myxococcota bacterium]|nr:DUF6176 family protein [Myxococcota bacterium]
MLNATFVRIRRQDVARLRAWLAELPARRTELAEAYRLEGTRHELFFLVEGESGPVLVLLSELADRERGRASFLRSRLPIDLEFKELIGAIEDGDVAAELLYDSAPVLAAAGPGVPPDEG